MPLKRLFRTSDRKLHVVLPSAALGSLLACCREAADRETGGILLGYYNKRHDTATVTYVSDPPKDSRFGRTWFKRGVLGLQQLITRLWREREYYLGEWHFHPDASPVTSRQDESQMLDIARSHAYQCPEPILVIVGGAESSYTFAVSIWFPSGESKSLCEIKAEDSCQ